MRGLLTTMLVMLIASASAQTKQEVKTYIEACEIQHPDIVLRQCIWETGHLNCTNCSMDGKNLFGFYWKGSYLRFATWQESVDYYCRWQARHYKGGDYYEFLTARGYASDPKYIEGLKSLDTSDI